MLWGHEEVEIVCEVGAEHARPSECQIWCLMDSKQTQSGEAPITTRECLALRKVSISEIVKLSD